jgi:hypothetical protein
MEATTFCRGCHSYFQESVESRKRYLEIYHNIKVDPDEMTMCRTCADEIKRGIIVIQNTNICNGNNGSGEEDDPWQQNAVRELENCNDE